MVGVEVSRHGLVLHLVVVAGVWRGCGGGVGGLMVLLAAAVAVVMAVVVAVVAVAARQRTWCVWARRSRGWWPRGTLRRW